MEFIFDKTKSVQTAPQERILFSGPLVLRIFKTDVFGRQTQEKIRQAFGMFQLFGVKTTRRVNRARSEQGERRLFPMGHVTPELFILRHWIHILLAVPPTFLHILEGDVGRHAAGHSAHSPAHQLGVTQGFAIKAKQPDAEIIMRMDGHAVPAVDYLERCLEVLGGPVGVVGGIWHVRPGADTTMARAIAEVVSHL